VFQLERCAECSNRNIEAVLPLRLLNVRAGIARNVPTGTFHFAEKFLCKLLILRAGFWVDQWNQGVRLLKTSTFEDVGCLLK